MSLIKPPFSGARLLGRLLNYGQIKKEENFSKESCPPQGEASPQDSAKKAKARASANPRETLLGRNHRERKMSPFTRQQKEKLLNLRDAMVDSMAGVAQDTLRSRAEGSEASAFGMHQADAGSDAYDRDFALSLLSQEPRRALRDRSGVEADRARHLRSLRNVGQTDPHARLEAIPFARFTVECPIAARKTK